MSVNSETEHTNFKTHVVRKLTIVHNYVKIRDAVGNRTRGKDLVMGRASKVWIGTFRTGADSVSNCTRFGTILSKTSPVVAQGADDVVLEGKSGIGCLCMELNFCRN